MADSSNLMPEDIAYLALEGGGGKGFAYLGALQLLDKHKVLDQIKGVAGTSAGAITALMISLGMNADEIATKIEETDFTSFFDDPNPRLIPRPSADPGQVGSYETRADSLKESAKLTSNLDPSAFEKLADNLQSTSEQLGPGHLPGWIVWAGIAPLLRGAAEQERTGSSLFGRALDGKFGAPVGQARRKLGKVFRVFGSGYGPF